MKEFKLVAFLLMGTALGLGNGRAATSLQPSAIGARTLPDQQVAEDAGGDFSEEGDAVGQKAGSSPLATGAAKAWSKDTDPSKGTDPSKAKKSAQGTASANDLVLVGGATTIRIKHVEVAGSSLSDGDVAALFAAKNATDLEARLRTLDAASILLSEIVVDEARPENASVEGAPAKDVTHMVQTQVLLADVHAGRAASGSAGGATVTVKGDKTNVTIKVGATTFKGLDLAQIVHLAAGPRTDDEAAKPLCDDLTVNATTIIGAAGEAQPLTIAAIHETGLKGRPPSSKPATTKADGSEASRAAFEAFIHDFAADLVEIGDVAVLPVADARTRDLKSFALKHAVLAGFGDGKLARFAINGLAVDSKPGIVKVASAEVLGVGSSGGAVPSVDRIDLRDAAIDVPAGDNKPDERIAFSVAHATYEAPGLVIGKLPSKAALVVEHIGFDVPASNAAAAPLLAMGYKHLDLSSAANSQYDATAQVLTIDRFSLSGTDMGALDLKLGLANVSEAIVSQNDEAQKAATAAVVVKSVDVTLHNAGLIDKAIAFKAAVDGIGVEQERTNIVQLIDTGLVGMGLQGSSKAQSIVAALHKFVEAPKTLHLAFSSKDGLGSGSMALMADPKALLDALDVEAGAGP